MAGGSGSQTGDVSETPSGQSVEAGPGEHTGAAREANFPPITGTEVSPGEQREAGEDAAVEPQQIQETEEEEEPPIDVDPLILRFVEECCKTGDERSAAANELYIAYLRWCDENDKLTLRQRDFGMNLSGMGFLRQRRAGGRHWWIGIGMAAKNEWSDENL